MLGDINPQTIKITSQAVVYPGRDHVTTLNIKQFNGRSYSAVDTSLLTRVVLAFPQTDPVIAYDTATAPAGTITWSGSEITIDLSDFSMPASVLATYLIAYDAEHPNGQVLVDDNDSVLEFDFRNVSAVGIVQPPVIELVNEAPIDGVTYGRKDGTWVSLAAVVAGVASVNGLTGVVVLGAADVGADATGTAAAAVAAHEVDTTPHTTLLNLTKVGFNTAAGATAIAAGDVVWNDTDKTLDIGVGGGVTLQAGQEVQVRGLNNSGATMLNGRAVFISGASGNRVVFALAQANQVTAGKTIAFLTQDIPNNQQGQGTVIGLVRDIDTSAFAEGNELWLSATVAGGVTNVRPVAPNAAVRIGYVVRSHATLGAIYVRIQTVESLDDLQDVVVTTPAEGDVIKYNAATSTWINSVGGIGEVNTASNLGAGSGVFAQKVTTDLQFKSLVAGANITLTPDATTITIASTGGSGSALTIQDEGTPLTIAATLINFVGAGVTVTEPVADQVTVTVPAAPVSSVDGQTGTVSLTASYAPLSHVGDTGAAHGNAVAAGAAGFMTGADKSKLDGVAAGANNYSHPNHTGDVTSVGDGAQTITANAVTNAKLADMATQTIKGRTTAATGDPEDLTATQVRTLINVADGATANSSDATLLARANHTGTQAISTVSGLQAALDAKTGLPVVATFTGNKTLALADINTYNVSQDATAQAVTLPAQATVAWTADAEIHIEQGGTGTVTVTGATGVTVNGVSAGSFALAGQYAVVTLKRSGADSWTLIGGIASAVVTGPASSGNGNLALFDGTTGKVIKDGGVVTAAGLALLDDASAAAQATTLGLGTGNSPTFTALTLTNGQIVFPAAQVPSANANTLDDYEEGTWTPTLTFATPGDVSVSYVVRVGEYTKIGNRVIVSYDVVTSAFTHTTASGNVQVTGLPFTITARSFGTANFQGITKASYTAFSPRFSTGDSLLTVAASGSGAGGSSVTAADMPTGGTVILQGTCTHRA